MEEVDKDLEDDAEEGRGAHCMALKTLWLNMVKHNMAA